MRSRILQNLNSRKYEGFVGSWLKIFLVQSRSMRPKEICGWLNLINKPMQVDNIVMKRKLQQHGAYCSRTTCTYCIKHLIHYLDDFFTAGPPDSLTCSHNMAAMYPPQHSQQNQRKRKVSPPPSLSSVFSWIPLQTVRLKHCRLSMSYRADIPAQKETYYPSLATCICLQGTCTCTCTHGHTCTQHPPSCIFLVRLIDLSTTVGPSCDLKQGSSDIPHLVVPFPSLIVWGHVVSSSSPTGPQHRTWSSALMPLTRVMEPTRQEDGSMSHLSPSHSSILQLAGFDPDTYASH